MTEKFKAKYEISDGYAGGSRPQYFTIDATDLDDDCDEQGLRDEFNQAMQTDFEQSICPESSQEDEFVEWAKEQIAKRKAENV